MKRRNLVRRVALVELTRQPAPLDYDHSPHNRAQRRQLARTLRGQATRSSGKGKKGGK